MKTGIIEVLRPRNILTPKLSRGSLRSPLPLQFIDAYLNLPIDTNFAFKSKLNSDLSAVNVTDPAALFIADIFNVCVLPEIPTESKVTDCEKKGRDFDIHDLAAFYDIAEMEIEYRAGCGMDNNAYMLAIVNGSPFVYEDPSYVKDFWACGLQPYVEIE